MYYQVPPKITKQEDGLWRVEAPSLQGCVVDEPTLAQALYEVHEVIAMLLDVNQEEGRPLPEEVKVSRSLPLYASIPVAPDEIEFYSVLPNRDRVPASAAAREKSGQGGKAVYVEESRLSDLRRAEAAVTTPQSGLHHVNARTASCHHGALTGAKAQASKSSTPAWAGVLTV